MSPEHIPGPLPLTSVSTTLFGRVAPAVATLCTWAAALMAWLSPEPTVTPAVKWTALGVAAVVSTVAWRWSSGFQHVWLEGEYLIVGDARRGVRVRLADVEEVRETRMQKVKWVKLSLAHRTSLGATIRFIPRGSRAWLVPWTTSPLVDELRERIQAAKGSEGTGAIDG